jgi:hypothetical protein
MKYMLCAGAIFCAMGFCAVGLSVSSAMDHDGDGYAVRMDIPNTTR